MLVDPFSNQECRTFYKSRWRRCDMWKRDMVWLRWEEFIQYVSLLPVSKFRFAKHRTVIGWFDAGDFRLILGEGWWSSCGWSYRCSLSLFGWSLHIFVVHNSINRVWGWFFQRFLQTRYAPFVAIGRDWWHEWWNVGRLNIYFIITWRRTFLHVRLVARKSRDGF